jgi:hypothetical protein
MNRDRGVLGYAGGHRSGASCRPARTAADCATRGEASEGASARKTWWTAWRCTQRRQVRAREDCVVRSRHHMFARDDRRRCDRLRIETSQGNGGFHGGFQGTHGDFVLERIGRDEGRWLRPREQRNAQHYRAQQPEYPDVQCALQIHSSDSLRRPAVHITPLDGPQMHMACREPCSLRAPCSVRWPRPYRALEPWRRRRSAQSRTRSILGTSIPSASARWIQRYSWCSGCRAPGAGSSRTSPESASAR